jgi:hypothetical protein
LIDREKRKERAVNAKFLIGVLILILATYSARNPTPRENGIEGQVVIGPMCSVGQACPDQPHQATLTLNSLNSSRIVQFQTDAGGRFKVPLEPGEYILHPESPNGLPFVSDQSFIVEADQYTQIIVRYDSSIR